MYDLAIVGAGPAGIATAYSLRDLNLAMTVLEAGGEVGGRTRSVPVGGVASNTGAMFVYRDSPAEEFATELGVRTSPFIPDTYGIHINGETLVDSDNHRLIDQLPISDAAREQLRTFVDAAMDEYAQFTRDGKLTEEADDLGGLSMAARMEGLEPDTAAIIRAAIRGGSVADPSELSAQYALRYFASYLAHEQHNRLYPVDGMQRIPEAMAARLPDGTVRLNTRVDRDEYSDADDCFLLTFNDEAEPLRAREVVAAVPAPVTREIVADLPRWKDDALAIARMAASTTLCITADITGLPHLARHAFIATAGRVFDCIINPHPVLPDHRSEPHTTVQFVCYGTSAGYSPDLVADPAGVGAWTEEFLAVFPDLRGRIRGAHLATWEHCFAKLTPERAQALPQLQESIGRLHFAGDHTSATAGTHGAYTEARRVAALIRSNNSRRAQSAVDVR